jgi:hypothetical protein
MSEYRYVEEPIIGWLSGEPKATYGARSLGWTYRDDSAMAAYERPLDDALVEKLLVAAILRINSDVETESQAKLAVEALRKTMSHPDKLTANRQTLGLLRDDAGLSSNQARTRRRSTSSSSIPNTWIATTSQRPTSTAFKASSSAARTRCCL